MLTIDFLKEKTNIKFYSPWCKEEISQSAGRGNINRISENVFTFTDHNYLPADETDILDGHYTFFVNYKTFEYLVYQSSFYGSLTYTTASKDKKLYQASDLPETSKKRVEAIIADKLLSAYFYDRNALFSNGKNLFSDGTQPEQALGCNKGILRWTDGRKGCLICDYRGYIWCDLKPEIRDKRQLYAIRKLDKGFKLTKLKTVTLISKKYGQKYEGKRTQTVILMMEATTTKGKFTLAYIKCGLYGTSLRVFKGKAKSQPVEVISANTGCHTFKEYYNALPKFFESL